MLYLNSAIQEALKYREQSPSPYTKVGCVITNPYGTVLSWGCNNPGWNIKPEFWEDREKARLHMIHAEIDALGRLASRLISATDTPLACVITLLPCTHCMSALAKFGVKTLYFMDMLERDKPSIEVASHYGITLLEV